MFDFQGAYEEVKDARCKMHTILLQGLGRTKQSVIVPALAAAAQARTLDQLKYALLEAHDYLDGLGIFSGVEIMAMEGNPEVPGTCNVRIKVRERNVVNASAGTYASGTEGSVEFTLGLTNPVGYAESVQASAAFGSQTSNEYGLVFRKPRLGGGAWDGEIRLMQHSKSWERQSSYAELLRGGSLGVMSVDGKHGLTYELDWRQLTDPGRLASRSVIAQCGHSLKSALRYVYTTSLPLGQTGTEARVAMRSSTEVAGLGPGSNLLRHVRQQCSLQGVRQLYGGSWLSWGVQAGVVLPWELPGGSRGMGPGGGGGVLLAKSTSICDRFFLGGPGSLWGFKLRGAGPTDVRRRREPGSSAVGETPGSQQEGLRRDVLGGDLFTTLTAAYNFPLPSEALRQAGIHAQFFVQGGSSVLLSGIGRPIKDSCEQFWNTFRWTMGAGIVWPTRLGNLEVNYCQVLKSHAHDRLRNGIQVGFTPTLPF